MERKHSETNIDSGHKYFIFKQLYINQMSCEEFRTFSAKRGGLMNSEKKYIAFHIMPSQFERVIRTN
jgi:hypothetical protein